MKTLQGIYIGRRLTAKGKLAYFWELDGAKEGAASGYLKQIAPALIGEQWEFTLTDEGSVYVSGEHKPKRVAAHALSPEQVDTHVAMEAVAEQEFSELRADKKLAQRQGQFERVLRPLQAMMDGLQRHDDRARFVARVTAELWRRRS